MDSRSVAQKFINHMEAMEVLDAFGMIGDDGRYIMIGTTPISGEYHGVAEVIAKMGPLLSKLTAPPPKISFSEIIVDGDRVVMLASALGEGLRGTTYRQPYYAFVARVRGDGFSELVEFSDTAMVEYAFFGKTLVDSWNRLIVA